MDKKRQRGSPQNPKQKLKFENPSKKKKKDQTINLDKIEVPLTNRFNVLDSGEVNDANAQQSVATSNKQEIAPIVVTDMKANIQKIIDDMGIDCDIKSSAAVITQPDNVH